MAISDIAGGTSIPTSGAGDTSPGKFATKSGKKKSNQAFKVAMTVTGVLVLFVAVIAMTRYSKQSREKAAFFKRQQYVSDENDNLLNDEDEEDEDGNSVANYAYS